VRLVALAGRAPVRRTNILLLYTVDRLDSIHALGNGEVRTPNLDAWLTRGTVFANCYK
jgi:hypothetical protein